MHYQHKSQLLPPHSYVSNQIVEVNTRKLETVLVGKNVEFTKIDGAAPTYKELRSALWEASGARTYPQLFIDGKVVAGGNFDDLQVLSTLAVQLSLSFNLLSDSNAHLGIDLPPIAQPAL